MRLLICGDRDWRDRALILRVLSSRMEDGIKIVIQGECRGADLMGKDAAFKLEIPTIDYPADWDKYGKAAGMLRNTQMLEEGRPDEVWAFHDDIASSRGTFGMMSIALRAKVTTYLVSHQGVWLFEGIGDLWLFKEVNR